MRTILASGVAGFIGSSFLRLAVEKGYQVIGLDKLTYAGHLKNIEGVDPATFKFVQGDISNQKLISELLKEHSISAVINFAAESHVDNSILGPQEFIQTNIVCVFHLLEAARFYYQTLPAHKKEQFRFLQVSTDEVFGALTEEEAPFSETTSYAPNSPYSASKASADHLVRAWYHTYGLPTVITNCSNNYGPRQFPEKLIPRMILNALRGESLPVYGEGKNIRDWIHVEDHVAGVLSALEKGTPGESYCFGGNSERRNIEVVHSICDILQKKKPREKGSYRELIRFVEDRAGHDFRYAINDSKAQNKLGFKRKYQNFEQGLDTTLQWYLENSDWINTVSQKK